jgi:SAM-dependent methyltransferase
MTNAMSRPDIAARKAGGESLCRVCEGPLGAEVVTAGSWTVRRCTACDAGVLVPLPSAAELDSAYHSGLYAPESGQVVRPLAALLDWFQARRLAFTGRPDGHGLRLLDVGSGKGRLLRYAAKKGYEVTGVEPHDTRSAFSVDAYGVRVFRGPLEDFPDEGAGFDVITSWHVLEHVPYPVEFLQAIRRLLRDDGVLAIEVPNLQNWAFRVTGGNWYQLSLPYHLEHFTPRSLRRACEAAGFEVVRMSTFSIEHGPFTWVQSLINRITGSESLLYRLLKRNWAPRSRGDFIELARQAVAVAIVLLLSPLLLVVSVVEARFGAGAVVRVVLRKKHQWRPGSEGVSDRAAESDGGT